MRLNPPETLVILFGLQGTSGSLGRKKKKAKTSVSERSSPKASPLA